MTNGLVAYTARIRWTKGISHVLDGAEWDSARFYHTPQNDARFETYELFISGIFNIIFGPQSATGNCHCLVQCLACMLDKFFNSL